MQQPDPVTMVELARKARLRLLQMHHEGAVGHIGGDLSALDAVLYLHLRVMTRDDTFVLSKGHAAGALYVTLWAVGQITDAELTQFHKDGTKLAGHPVAHWHPWIPFATGSLGHGLGLAAGVALGKRLRRDAGNVYCLMSDGECEEGSTWESLIFARHHGLSNLVALIDANGLQGLGTTTEVASLEPLREKIGALGLRVEEIDGHAPEALRAPLDVPRSGPLVVVLRTTKGHGVSFMEDRMEWHYLPMTGSQYEQALSEVAER
jgi:transketolase